MALIPYEPFRHLENIRREFDRLFAGELPVPGGTPGQGFGNPSLDIFETDQEVVAKCDLPGLEKKDDVAIDIENNVLSLSGTVNRISETRDERMHRQERFYGRFQRSVPLPARVSPEGVKAAYRNGVLEIHMPKAQGDSRKKIEIDFH